MLANHSSQHFVYQTYIQAKAKDKATLTTSKYYLTVLMLRY